MIKQKQARPQRPAAHQRKIQARPPRATPAPEPVRHLISVPFTVYGPFDTPIKREGNGTISFPSESATNLFARSGAKDHSSDVGCYIMARQFADSFTPFYVGQTTRSFAKEVFDVHKREKYRLAAQDCQTGKWVLFLLIPNPGHTSGRTNAIRDLERHLIERGKKANPKLLNKQLVPKPMFRLEGIDNAPPGQPLKEVQHFKRMMGYETKGKAARKR